MKSLLKCLSVTCCLLFSPLAQAQVSTSLMFDCWVGNVLESTASTHLLRCMPGMDNPAWVADTSPDRDLVMLNLHSSLHSGDPRSAERVFRANTALLGGVVTSVLLYTYPYEWSWAEQRPQRLARSVLCPDNVACDIFVFRSGQE